LTTECLSSWFWTYFTC